MVQNVSGGLKRIDQKIDEMLQSGEEGKIWGEAGDLFSRSVSACGLEGEKNLKVNIKFQDAT